MITSQQAAKMSPMQRMGVLRQVEAALKKDRRNVDALLSGAALHYADKRLDEAIGLLQKAFAIRKKDLMVLRWLAVATAEARNYKQAKIYARKLVEAEPGNADNWHIRGRTLDAAGDPAGALAAFERVEKLAGENPELTFQIANCHYYMGDLAAAEKGYLKTLAMEPHHAMAIYGYSTLHKFAADEVEEFAARAEAAIPLNRDMPIYNISALYYAIAKAREDAGQFDSAFAAYLKANQCRKPANTDDLARPFESARAAFTPALYERRQGWGDPATMPIFVLGMPRSGTTLVESIAAAHSAVSPGGEMAFIDDIAMQLGAMRAPPREFANAIARLDRRQIAERAKQYVTEAHQISGARNRFIDKMPHNFMNIGLIFLLFPNARIIHCRRHPIDTCVSIFTNGMTPAHNYYKSELDVLGRYYRLYLNMMAYWHRLFPGRILDVVYEDVVANTALNSRRIIDYLGLDWEETVLSRDGSQKSVKTLSALQVRQPIYRSAMGKWRRFETHLAPLIETLGPVTADYEAEIETMQKAEA